MRKNGNKQSFAHIKFEFRIKKNGLQPSTSLTNLTLSLDVHGQIFNSRLRSLTRIAKKLILSGLLIFKVVLSMNRFSIFAALDKA